MKREEKTEYVKELQGEFAKAKAAYLTAFTGLRVIEIDDLRKKIHKAGGHYRVLKNTFARISTVGTPFERLTKEISGPIGWAITDKDPVPLAKVIKEFAKDRELFSYHRGMVDGLEIDRNGIESLADLPPKEVLLAQILGALNAPAQSLLSVIQAVPRQLVNVIEAIRKKKEEEESKNG